LFSFPQRRDRPLVPSSLLVNWYRQLFLSGHSGRGVNLITHLFLLSRLKIHGAILYSPHTFMTCSIKHRNTFSHWLYSPLGPWPLIFQFHDHFTDGRTPWTSDQPVARPLPKHRTTQTQNKHILIPNTHTLCGRERRQRMP
jgi:hypothetical protein